MNNINKYNEFAKDRVLVFLNKNKDYGDSFLNGLLKFGRVSADSRIWDKVNRFVMLNKSEGNACVNDESIEDTVLDLFNYCMMFKSFEDDGAYIMIEDIVKNMMIEINCNFDGYIKEYLKYLDVEDKVIFEILNKLNEILDK